MAQDSLKTRVDRQLRACGALGAAALGAVAGLAPVDAQGAVYSVSTTLYYAFSGTTYPHILLDFGSAGSPGASYKVVYDSVAPGGVILDSYPSYEWVLRVTDVIDGAYFVDTATNTATFNSVGYYPGSPFAYPYKLGSSYTIDGSSTFDTGTGAKQVIYVGTIAFPYVDWTDGDKGYAGFKMTKGTSYYYGYVSLATSSTGFTFYGFAWESSAGVAITTPVAVPEPASTSLAGLAMGAVGVASWRRRRQSTDAA